MERFTKPAEEMRDLEPYIDAFGRGGFHLSHADYGKLRPLEKDGRNFYESAETSPEIGFEKDGIGYTFCIPSSFGGLLMKKEYSDFYPDDSILTMEIREPVHDFHAKRSIKNPRTFMPELGFEIYVQPGMINVICNPQSSLQEANVRKGIKATCVLGKGIKKIGAIKRGDMKYNIYEIDKTSGVKFNPSNDFSYPETVYIKFMGNPVSFSDVARILYTGTEGWEFQTGEMVFSLMKSSNKYDYSLGLRIELNPEDINKAMLEAADAHSLFKKFADAYGMLARK